MSKGIAILAFSLGATVGAVASWVILKKKYEHKMQEVSESMESVFAKREKRLAAKYEGPQQANDISEEQNEDAKNYGTVVNALGYSGEKDNTEEEEDEYMEKPYVIPPEEFDILDDYKAATLTYYDDGILTDEFDDVIENVDEIVGYDAFKHFGEYEDDAVYVRNDVLKCDYEILYDQRKYSDVDR